MGRKLVIGLLVLGVAGATVGLLTRHFTKETPPLEPLGDADQSADANSISPPPATKPAELAATESASPALATRGTAGEPAEPGAQTPEAMHEAYVAKRVGELLDLGMEEDSASLETILSEVDSSDPSIRQAALEAAV